jgi:hypothetical protein
VYAERIEDLRNQYLWPRHNVEEVKELTRRELLKYNPDTTRLMTKQQLQKALLPFFAKYPKLFSWNYLHELHIKSHADAAKRLEKDRKREVRQAYGLTPKPSAMKPLPSALLKNGIRVYTRAVFTTPPPAPAS